MRLTQERLKKLIDYDKRTEEFTWNVDRPTVFNIGGIPGYHRQGGWIISFFMGQFA